MKASDSCKIQVVIKGIMENIDMSGFVFYPGYGMVR